MSESEAAVASNPSLGLPCPLPPAAPGEPPELAAFRSGPIHDSTFVQLRRRFREAEDWRSLATLLVLYAARTDSAAKVGELCLQAHELWLDRVKDKQQAAYALARAVLAQPDNERLQGQLYQLYDEIGAQQERLILLRWRIRELERKQPAAVPGALCELGRILEENFMAIKEAIAIYERALQRDRKNRAASEALIRLYFHAGAYQKASELMTAELGRLDSAEDRERIAELHLRLARIDHEVGDNIASAAVHLQSALKAMPDNVRALRAFGVMYLTSGKASDEGLHKASDVFFRAAKLAHGQGDQREALKLLRRTLSLRPDHYDAGVMLAELLSARERWTELDDLYASWINYVAEEDAYSLWMQRGELLDSHLARREDARLCFEQACRYEAPEGEAWRHLEALYLHLGDTEALVGLLEAHAEQAPQTVPIEVLLRAAQLHRDELHNDERASHFFYQVLEREPFNAAAFEGYKEHWRRKKHWNQLRDLIYYQVDQAAQHRGPGGPLQSPGFAEEFVELAEICERRLGDLDGALDSWQRLAHAFPSDWRPRDHITRLDKRIRMLDQMMQAQEHELARATAPEQRLAILRRLTQVYRERTCDPQRAVDLLHELLSLAPDDAQAEEALAEMYARADDHEGLLALLRQRYEAARRPAQQMAILRQMEALWHDHLRNYEDAIWACEQLLNFRADDLEILHRLQNLTMETGQSEGLYAALERELAITSDPKVKVRLLRRMGNVAETRLGDSRRASRVYADLLAVDPHNLEIIDKMAAIYENSGRYEDLSGLLQKAAASPRTPPIRQLDYLMRLGHIAEGMLGDPDLACSAFERVLRIHRDHRGAVEALTRLYRTINSWHGLAGMLGNLQELVDTDEEVLQLGLERAEVLADRLDNASAAARVLEQLQATIAPVSPHINIRLADYYNRAGDTRKLIRHAEIMLLSIKAPAERRILFERISKAWIDLGDARAGLAAFDRYAKEAGEDVEALRILGELQELAGDYQSAVKTLDRRLGLVRDPGQQVAILERMAELCEAHLDHHKRALSLLGRALGIAPQNAGIKAKLEAYAAKHGMWKDLLHAYGERYSELSQRGDVRGQLEMCMGASKIAEAQVGDITLAYNWAKKAYFVALEAGAETRAAVDRLEALAEAHGLWEKQLAVVEEELKLRADRDGDRKRGGDFAILELLLDAAEIARERLADPRRSIAFLQRAAALRPDDPEISRQIEGLAETHQLWPALVEFHEARLARATTQLARFEAQVALARLLEAKLGDPKAAVARLGKAWGELGGEDQSLAEEMMDIAVTMAERHGLHAALAELRRAAARRSLQRGKKAEGLAALQEAATIEETRCDDRLAALRTLREGIAHDRGGQIVMTPLREVAARLDAARPAGEPPIGALTVLQALQERCGLTEDPAEKIALVRERARLRENELDDLKGAMAEWLRIFGLSPQGEEARFELQRLAERGNLWDHLLLLPAWEIERMRASRRPGQPPTPKAVEQESQLWIRLADLFADHLQRPEYALRARLAAWRLRPTLPPAAGELGPIHGSIWALAAATGRFQGPPPTRDPLLLPQMLAPEIADDALWRRAGLQAATLLPRREENSPAAPAPRRSSGVQRAPAPRSVTSPTTAIVDLADLESVEELAAAPEVTGVVDIAELSEIEAVDAIPPRESTGIVDISEIAEVSELSELSDVAEIPPRESTGVVDIAEISEIEPLDDDMLVADEAERGTLDLAPDDPGLVELRTALGGGAPEETAEIGTLDLAPDDPELLEFRASLGEPSASTLDLAPDDPGLVEFRASLEEPTSQATLDLAPDDPELLEFRASLDASAASAAESSDGPEVIELRAPPRRDADAPVAAKTVRPRPPAPGSTPPPPRAPGSRPGSRPHAAPPPRPRSAPLSAAPSAPPPAPPSPPAAPPSPPAAPPSPPAAARPAPPPSPALTAGLPPIPELSAPILPPRPAVASAWAEVLAAYREVAAPKSEKAEKVEQALALARALDEGAGDVAGAFAELEAALVLIPDHPGALRALDALASRSGDVARQIEAYTHLLAEATLPEHVVDLSLRLAELHARADSPAKAEECYRSVLAVLPQHRESLAALAAIYDAAGRDREYVEIRGRLVDLLAPEADADARVDLVRGLARDLDARVHRPADAIRKLEALAREFPARLDVQEDLAALLLREREWAPAAAVLEAALRHADGDDRLRLTARLAALQEGELGAPEAAIRGWEAILGERPDDAEALAHLQELYLGAGRFDALLKVLDRRLALAGDDRAARALLLVVKARALQEGFGDEEGATATLEALADEDPENDAVILGLSRLYRRAGRQDEGIKILRERLDDLEDEAHEARKTISLALSAVLSDEVGDPEEAMIVIEEALAGTPEDRVLLVERARLSRLLKDTPVLVDALAAVGDPAGLLEAAGLARSALSDAEWASRLYADAIAAIDRTGQEPAVVAQLSAAIEGLVVLHLAADPAGIDALVADQLAAIPHAAVRAAILCDLGRAIWSATGDLEAARARFAAALVEDPEQAAARLGLGEVLIAAGQFEEAEPMLEEAVESYVLARDQEHLVAGLCLLARLFEATDRAADAYRRLTSALRQDPQNLGIRAAIVRNRHGGGRWKEALAVLEAVDAQLAEGQVFGRADRALLREMYVLAAECERGLDNPAGELHRLGQAVQIDPEHAETLRRLIDLCAARGLTAEQARTTIGLAHTSVDPLEQGRLLIEAGMLFEATALAIEAAAAETASGALTDAAKAEIEGLRSEAFEALRAGLGLVIDHPTPVVERRHLEVAFWVSISRDTDTALACLERLLLRDDLRADLRMRLLLAGVRLGLDRRAEGDIERAYGYAALALEAYPDRAAPVMAMFDVLEAYGGDEAQEHVERLVLGFFNQQGLRSRLGDEEEDALRGVLLIRLAETQHEHPERAIRLLEKAAAQGAQGLGVAERRHLTRLYLAAGAEPARIRRNYEAILELEPTDRDNLRALARLCEAAGDLDQAHALRELGLTLDPGDEEAAAFLGRHRLTLGAGDTFDTLAIQDPPPPSGGMIEAMSQLWKGGAAILCEKLPRIDVGEAALLKDEGDFLVSTWADTRARLGAPPYPLVDADAVKGGEVPGGWLLPHCQYPPVMLAGPKAKYEAQAPHLRFTIGRGLFAARPGNLLIAALPREQMVAVLSATLLSFHPRHAKRRQFIRDDDEFAGTLSSHFGRKLPTKVARQIAQLFQDHEGERFDSREWRLWVERGSNRMGLCAAGELGPALDILGLPERPEARAKELRERGARDPLVRDLLAFAGGARYAAARRSFGFHLEEDAAARAREPASAGGI